MILCSFNIKPKFAINKIKVIPTRKSMNPLCREIVLKKIKLQGGWVLDYDYLEESQPYLEWRLPTSLLFSTFPSPKLLGFVKSSEGPEIELSLHTAS